MANITSKKKTRRKSKLNSSLCSDTIAPTNVEQIVKDKTMSPNVSLNESCKNDLSSSGKKRKRQRNEKLENEKELKVKCSTSKLKTKQNKKLNSEKKNLKQKKNKKIKLSSDDNIEQDCLSGRMCNDEDLNVQAKLRRDPFEKDYSSDGVCIDDSDDDYDNEDLNVKAKTSTANAFNSNVSSSESEQDEPVSTSKSPVKCSTESNISKKTQKNLLKPSASQTKTTNDVPEFARLMDSGAIWGTSHGAPAPALGHQQRGTSLQTMTGDDAPSSEDEDQKETAAKTKRRNKRQARLDKQKVAAEQEADLRYKEKKMMLQGSSGEMPDTEMRYLELLEANKACSATWIQLMSFHLANRNIEEARQTARDALAAIPGEEQGEREQLWVARLRLEVLHGTAAEVDQVLAVAVNNVDDYTIRSAMAGVWQDAGETEKAEALLKLLCKKYFREQNVWAKLGQFYYELGRLEEARDTLKKGLHVLNRKGGTDLTSRFGQLEYRLGDRTKGASMFDALLANHPKRLDVWGLYADLLVKGGQIEEARSTLTKQCSLPLRFSKIKSSFAKLLAFERRHGSDVSLQAAKDKLELLVKRESDKLEQMEQ